MHSARPSTSLISPDDPTLLRHELERDLAAVRRRLERLTAPLDDDTLHSQHDSIMSPLVWDVGHVGNCEELWLLREVAGRPAHDPGLDHVYNPFENPRWVRGDLPVLPRAEAGAYLADVRAEALEVLRSVELGHERPLLAGGYVYRMIVQHESQHQETMLQTLDLRGAAPDAASEPYGPAAARRLPALARPVDDTERVTVAGGPFRMGTDDRSSAYDNERPSHVVEVPAFALDRFPVTARRFAAFVADRGYARPELWSQAGRAWLAETGERAPQGWERDGDGGELPGRRERLRGRAAPRRRVRVDLVALHRLPGLLELPVPRVQRGLLRRRLPRAARCVVGDGPVGGPLDLPQLGLPAAPPALRGAAPGLGRRLMCRMAAYLGPSAPLAVLLSDPPYALGEQAWRARIPGPGGGNAVNVDGTGVVWWPAGEEQGAPLRYVTELPPWADPNLLGLAARLEGTVQLSLVRSATPGLSYGAWSVAPFVHGRVAVAHNGSIRGFRGAPGRRLLERLPDDLLGELGALTDSAVLAALVAAELRDRGPGGRKSEAQPGGRPPADRGLGGGPAAGPRGPEDLAGALGAAVLAVEKVCADAGEAATLTVLAADGERLAGVRAAIGRASHPLFTLALSGALLAASEPLDDDPGWVEVPDRHLVELTAAGARRRPLDGEVP